MQKLILMVVSLIAISYSQSWGQADGASVVLQKRQVPIDPESCKNCHLTRSAEHRNIIKKIERNHEEKDNMVHGTLKMACVKCHDRENHNLLNTGMDNQKITFENSSPICQQCHGKIFKDWQNGVHGKRLGGWNLQKVQFQCVDCHNPHSVSFPKMKAEPPPHKPHLK